MASVVEYPDDPLWTFPTDDPSGRLCGPGRAGPGRAGPGRGGAGVAVYVAAWLLIPADGHDQPAAAAWIAACRDRIR